MIGHYLLTLTRDQEDRVLTTAMGAEGRNSLNSDRPRCIIQATFGRDDDVMDWERSGQFESCEGAWIPGRYDDLCERFGEPRVNAAIRNRILSNRARRILGNAVECVGAGPTTETHT